MKSKNWECEVSIGLSLSLWKENMGGDQVKPPPKKNQVEKKSEYGKLWVDSLIIIMQGEEGRWNIGTHTQNNLYFCELRMIHTYGVMYHGTRYM